MSRLRSTSIHTLIILSSSYHVVIAAATIIMSCGVGFVVKADTTTPHSANENNPETDRLIHWIRSVGGYVDPRQEIRNADPNDSNSLRGIYATEAIQSGDFLLYLPWNATIIAADQTKGDVPDSCGMVRALRRELELGSAKSKYGPYVELLNQQRMQEGQIGVPNTWSSAGLDLLAKVVGNNLSPNDVTRHLNWWLSKEHGCSGDLEDQIGVDAAMLMVARAIETKTNKNWSHRVSAMAPLYDLYNHRHGTWHNTAVSTRAYVEFTVSARRDISKGEQLYNIYGYGAADIFRDYGFVEQTPQLWEFQIPADVGEEEEEQEEAIHVGFWVGLPNDFDHRGSAEAAMSKDDLVVQWMDRPDRGSFNEERTIQFFSLELNRLGIINVEELATKENLPVQEGEKILAYHEAVTTAIRKGLEVMRAADTSGSNKSAADNEEL